MAKQRAQLLSEDDLDATSAEVGVAAYRLLTGEVPAQALIDDDTSFDRHVFASILAVAATEAGTVADGVGLPAREIAALVDHWFPAVVDADGAAWRATDRAADDEMLMVRDLLLANRSTDGDAGRWLAVMIARRAMESNHLWEDLGLRNRTELSRLLQRHFAPLAGRNIKNMRWKRFFYRMLCEDDGLVMCSTPVCSNCADFDLCFGDESGESRLAATRRALALGSVSEAGRAAASPL